MRIAPVRSPPTMSTGTVPNVSHPHATAAMTPEIPASTATTEKTENRDEVAVFKCRDPASNRGHHDFQS
jgi:hypothetical protein